MYISLRIFDNKIVIADYDEIINTNIIKIIDKTLFLIDFDLKSCCFKDQITRKKHIITFSNLSLLFDFLKELTRHYTIILE